MLYGGSARTTPSAAAAHHHTCVRLISRVCLATLAPRTHPCAGGFKVEEDEEFEDDEGNVFNRKTYMDLKRQGLL